MLQKSFKRDAYFDWRMYSHIVLRVRGDGRSYMLNLSTMGYYDIMWNDIYSYVLFTRGGPYWQVSKVKYRRQDLRGIWCLLVTLCNSLKQYMSVMTVHTNFKLTNLCYILQIKMDRMFAFLSPDKWRAYTNTAFAIVLVTHHQLALKSRTCLSLFLS